MGGGVQSLHQSMEFPKSVSLWILLAVMMAALAMLVLLYFQGGTSHAFPPPEPAGWLHGGGGVRPC